MRQGQDVEGLLVELQKIRGVRLVLSLSVAQRQICRFPMTLEEVALAEDLTLSGDFEELRDLVQYSELNLPIPDADGWVRWTQVGSDIRVETSDDVQLLVTSI